MAKSSLQYGFKFTRDVFAHHQNILADIYRPWKRVLVVMDGPVTSVCSKHYRLH